MTDTSRYRTVLFMKRDASKHVSIRRQKALAVSRRHGDAHPTQPRRTHPRRGPERHDSERLEPLERLLASLAGADLTAQRRAERVAHARVGVAAARAAHRSLEGDLEQTAVRLRGRDAEALELGARLVGHLVGAP